MAPLEYPYGYDGVIDAPIFSCTYTREHDHLELKGDGTWKKWSHRSSGTYKRPKPDRDNKPNPAFAKARNPMVRTDKKLQRGF